MPYLVLGTGLVVTFVAAALVQRQVTADDRLRFAQDTDLLLRAFHEGFEQYEDALRATAGLVEVSDTVSEDAFAHFVSQLDVEHRPGLRAIAWVVMVSDGDAPPPSVVGPVRVWPASERDLHAVVADAAPRTEANRRVIGFDLMTSKPRREALEAACASGELGVSEVVSLVAAPSPDLRPGFLLAMPIYASGRPTSCANVEGYMVAALEREPFFESVDDGLPDGQIDFAISDGSDELYRTSPPPHPIARFEVHRPVRAGGREWMVRTWPGPRFGNLSQGGLVPSVLVAGVLISLALFGLVWSETRARAQAERVAHELYRSEAALSRANQAKDEFVAMLGHELRNPLSAMKMALDILRGSDIDDDDARAAIEVADRQMRHQTRLVDDLLDVSRVSRGKIVLKPEQLDLRDVVADAVIGIESTAAGARHGFTVDRPNDPVLVEGDPTRLEQVASNLLSNAVKYSPDGARIHVTVEARGGTAVLRVRDNGVGIEADALERIFDLFAQENASLDRSAGGLGIGLTLVKRLVEMHGGTVEARSEGRGFGSEFLVQLPLATGAAESLPAKPGAQGRSPLRILLVEDNEDARLMLRSLLEKEGHQVETASDGESGVQAGLERPPDVALVDIGLPTIDGFEVVRRLRRAWGDDHIPVVAVTGYGQPSDRDRAMEAGFDHHLVKPVDPTMLRDLLADVAPAQS